MGKYAKDQLSGAAGYVYQVETALTDIKRNLFYQLRQSCVLGANCWIRRT